MFSPMYSSRRRLFHFILFSLTAWVVLATPLLAEDVAERRVLGFSPNGDTFAFEEFGRLNGSRYPYANIYVIDTVRNKWVKGSPFRVVIEKPRATRMQARRRVEQQAGRMLARFNVTRRGVRILASNPISELSASHQTVKVNPRISIFPVDRPLVFTIRLIDMPTPRCRRITRQRIRGLVISVQREGERAQELHRDKRIPGSRGCPVAYAISDIVQVKKQGGGAVYAVIYSIIRQGKNGAERRFIAGGWHDAGDRRDPDYYNEANVYSDYDMPYYYGRSRDAGQAGAGAGSGYGGPGAYQDYRPYDYDDPSQQYKPR